jgi:integrase
LRGGGRGSASLTQAKSIELEIDDARIQGSDNRILLASGVAIHQDFPVFILEAERWGPIISEKQTVGKFLDHWLTHVVKSRVRPKTFRSYSDLVKNHISPGIGDIPLGKLSVQHVRKFLNTKLAVQESPRKTLSARTVKHLLVTLRGALAVAVKDGQIQRNVAALVDPPRVPRTEPRVFSPEQARAFLNSARGSRLEAAFTTAVAVGLRQGEILGLNQAG